MKNSETTLKNVAFLGYEDGRGMKHLIGTAFFVEERWEQHPYTLTYIVTAKHLIGALRESSIVSVLLRVNKVGGGAEWIASDIDDWADDPLNPLSDVSLGRVDG